MMNASRRSRTSSKTALRPSQIIRRRSSRLRHPFTEYIRNGARAVSEALNAITTVFAPIHNNTRNTDVVVRFEREQTPEGDFHQTVAPFPGDDDAVAPTAQVGDNAGAALQNPSDAQPQPQATSVAGIALVAIPIARRTIRRRDGTIAPPAQPSWQEPMVISVPRPLQPAGTQPAAPRRRAPLQREGAFHEDLMPLDAPARQEVAGRDPSTLYENLVWEAQWGPIPRFADIAGYGDAPPTTPQVLAYLNDRFRLNRRAYNTALDVLFPPEGRAPRDPPIVRGEPAFQHVAPTALWRRDADWEGGVVPVDREWGAPQADDAADPEAPPFDPAEFAYSEAAAEEDMAELTDEELRAIGEHVSACLAARQARMNIAALSASSPSSPAYSRSASTSLPGPSSIAPSRSPASRKAARGTRRTQGTRHAASASASSATRRKLRSSTQAQSHSRAQAFARRSDRRNVARARLQATIRKNLKQRQLARAARSSSPSPSPSSSRRSSPRSRPQTRASTAARSLPPSPRTPASSSSSASPSRQLRSAKRSRREEVAVPSPARDGSPRNKRARRS